MSIIYDALKKAEKNKTSSVINNKKSNKLPHYLIYLLMVIIAFFVGSFVFNLLNQLLLKRKDNSDLIKKEAIMVNPEKEIPSVMQEMNIIRPSLDNLDNKDIPFDIPKLNGIFYDSVDPYVLIDNRIFKRGDCFKNYCIKNIFSDRIEMVIKSNNTVIEIKMGH
ncbi:MAG: hypothetical protein NC826_02205 [Candidatus Omnitrophica bacterium]|nr:hypothetical protein [Candidatus Omnitrophota bacterium]